MPVVILAHPQRPGAAHPERAVIPSLHVDIGPQSTSRAESVNHFPNAPSESVDCLPGSGPQLAVRAAFERYTSPVVDATPLFVVNPSCGPVPRSSPQSPHPDRSVSTCQDRCDKIAGQAITFSKNLPAFHPGLRSDTVLRRQESLPKLHRPDLRPTSEHGPMVDRHLS